MPQDAQYEKLIAYGRSLFEEAKEARYFNPIFLAQKSADLFESAIDFSDHDPAVKLELSYAKNFVAQRIKDIRKLADIDAQNVIEPSQIELYTVQTAVLKERASELYKTIAKVITTYSLASVRTIGEEKALKKARQDVSELETMLFALADCDYLFFITYKRRLSGVLFNARASDIFG